MAFLRIHMRTVRAATTRFFDRSLRWLGTRESEKSGNEALVLHPGVRSIGEPFLVARDRGRA
jgi:hypothetical protein